MGYSKPNRIICEVQYPVKLRKALLPINILLKLDRYVCKLTMALYQKIQTTRWMLHYALREKRTFPPILFSPLNSGTRYLILFVMEWRYQLFHCEARSLHCQNNQCLEWSFGEFPQSDYAPHYIQQPLRYPEQLRNEVL